VIAYGNHHGRKPPYQVEKSKTKRTGKGEHKTGRASSEKDLLQLVAEEEGREKVRETS